MLRRLLICLALCIADAQTRTATSSSSRTLTRSRTRTSSFTATRTRTSTPTRSATYTTTRSRTQTSSASSSFTQSRTPTRTATASSSFTSSRSRTSTQSSTVTMTRTRTGTASHTSTASYTATTSPTRSRTRTGTGSSSYTGTRTRTATPTSTGTMTRTRTQTATPTSTVTMTRTRTGTASHTSTASYTATTSPTRSRTRTGTGSSSYTGTRTRTATPTSTVTVSRTSSNTPSRTATSSYTGTMSRTQSRTRTGTGSSSYTGTRTRTATPTSTVTVSRSSSNTPSRTATSSYTGTMSRTSSRTRTGTGSSSYTGTRTRTSTQTRSASVTRTSSYTGTMSRTSSRTRTGTGSSSYTGTQTRTSTQTSSASLTRTSSRTRTQTASSSVTGTLSRSRTATSSATRTQSQTSSGSSSYTGSRTRSYSPTQTPVWTRTSSYTATQTRTSSPTSSRSLQPFNSNSVVVLQIGSGLNQSMTVPITLLEIAEGQLLQTIPITDVSLLGCLAPHQAGISGCSVFTHGHLVRSWDKRYLSLAGYYTSSSSHNSVLSVTSTIPRSVTRIDWLGAQDTSTTWQGFRSTSGTMTNAVTKDGLGYYVVGTLDDGGVRYISHGGSATTTNIDSTSAGYYRSARFSQDGLTLYISDSYSSTSDPYDGGYNYINYMSPLTTTSQPINNQYLLLNPAPGYITDFYVGTNILYVTDYPVGLRIYTGGPTSWVEAQGSPRTAGSDGNFLSLDVDGDRIYITSPTTLYQYNTTSNTWTTVWTAHAGYELRGVAFAPQPLSTSSATGSASATRSWTSSATQTSIRTYSSSMTWTGSSTPSGTPTQTPTTTSTASTTPTPTPTSSPTPTQTSTPTPTSSPTPTPSGTPTPTTTPTSSNTPTPTRTPSTSGTATGTYTSTHTSTQSATSTATSSATYTTWPRALTFSVPCQFYDVTVPQMVRNVRVSMWGAGGGARVTQMVLGTGGGGAFVTGILRVIPGETLRVQVGQRGTVGGLQQNASCGGGREGGVLGGSGGGMTSIWRDTVPIGIAAGGGGSSAWTNQPSTQRISIYAGAGGLETGMSTLYEFWNNSQLRIGTLPNQEGTLSACDTLSGGGGGYVMGASSCIYGAGGGSSYRSMLRDSSLSESGSQSNAGGMLQKLYRTGAGVGQSAFGQAGNGMLSMEWVWPAQESETSTPSPSQTFIPIQARPTPTMTPIAIIEKTTQHGMCWQGPINATSTITLQCSGSVLSSIMFMGCGNVRGDCNAYSRGSGCWSSSGVSLFESTCIGKSECALPVKDICGRCYVDTSSSILIDYTCRMATVVSQRQAQLDAISRGTTQSSHVNAFRIRSTFGQSEGEMRFGEFQVFAGSSNIASNGIATSSSVALTVDTDIDFCGAPSSVAEAGNDGDLCTFVKLDADPHPWWMLTLVSPVLLKDLTRVQLYTADVIQDMMGVFYDYAYQIDGAIVEVVDPNDSILFVYTLPWISQMARPHIINMTNITSILPP